MDTDFYSAFKNLYWCSNSLLINTVLFIGFYNKAEFVVDINSFNEHWMNSLWSAMILTVHQFKNLSYWKGEKEISQYITLP